MKRMKIKWKKQPGLYLFSLFLIAVLMLGQGKALASDADIPEGAESADERNVENTYAFKVSTGAADGTAVRVFQIHYTDENNIAQIQYVAPFEDDSVKSEKQAASKGGSALERARRVKEYSKYEFDTTQSVLASESVTTILFSTESKIKTVDGIDIIMQAPEKKHSSWDCLGMSVYEVYTLHGLDMSGYYSAQQFVSFRGQLLANAEINRAFNVNTDSIFSVRPEGTMFSMKSYEATGTADYDSESEEYYFEIGIEDSMDAGIDALINSYTNSVAVRSMNPCEMLALTVSYRDIYGQSRQVNLPFITSMQAWACEFEGVGDAKVNGFAQQGEKIGFAGILPDCVELLEYRLTYGGSAAQKKLFSNELKTVSEQDDSLVLNYMAVYRLGGKVTASASVEDGCLVCSVDGAPSWAYVKYGEVIPNGTSVTHRFSEYAGGTALEPIVDYSKNYLIRLKTDAVSAAGTLGDLYIQLNYKDTTGYERESAEYSLRELSTQLYGDGPRYPDMKYYQSVAAGQTLEVVVSLANVAQFTGIRMRLEGGDEWQMSELELLQLDEMSTRKFKWGSPVKLARSVGNETDRTVYRNFRGNSIYTLTTTSLLNPGDTKSMVLDGGKTVTKDDDYDWSDSEKSMDYVVATQNLGFSKTRYSYTVRVQVASDTETGLDNDDCGSANLFYFQLLFENGRSSYVLSNEQLQADSFRSGVEETFAVYMNKNYGELTGVNIIADSVGADSTVFDKLKVEAITVELNPISNANLQNAGITKTWVINNVGWVNIMYKDKTQITTASREAELVQSYLVDYSSYCVNLQVNITTKGFRTEQLQGEVSAIFWYYNQQNELVSKSVNITRALYEFDRRQGSIITSATRKDGSYTVSSKTGLSDPNYMFRANHTDRFQVSLDNIKSLYRISIQTANVVETTVWEISSVDVYMINGSGEIFLNKNDEYEYHYDTKLVCSSEAPSVTEAGYSCHELYAKTSGVSEKNIRFESNEFQIQIESDVVTSTITREPKSTVDSFNVFVYPQAGTLNPSDYNLKATLGYYDVERDTSAQLSLGTLKRAGDNSYFYGLGYTARNVAGLAYLALQDAETRTARNACIDYAIIQRVRADVLIDTYYVSFTGADAFTTPYRAPDQDESMLQKGRQAITLKLGTGFTDKLLTAETADVAFAIRYTTTLGGDAVYMSPYTFLTDQEITRLSAGQILELELSYPFVKDIVGLVLVGTGGISVPVDSAYIKTYTIAEGDDGRILDGWYSFKAKDGFMLTNQAKTIEASAMTQTELTSLSRVDLTFTNHSGTTVTDANGNIIPQAGSAGFWTLTDGTKASATIRYVDYYGGQRTYVIENLADHLGVPRDQVASLTEAKVSVLVPGIRDILSISFGASGPGTNSYWNLMGLTLSVDTPLGTVTRTADYNTVIVAGEPYTAIQTSMLVQIKASYYTNAAQGTLQTVEGKNEDINVVLDSGQPLMLNITRDNAWVAETVEAYQLVENVPLSVSGALSGANGSYTFNPPANHTGANIVYQLVISYASDMQYKVTVVVMPESVTEDSGGTDRGGNTDADNGGSSGNGESGGGDV